MVEGEIEMDVVGGGGVVGGMVGEEGDSGVVGLGACGTEHMALYCKSVAIHCRWCGWGDECVVNRGCIASDMEV